MPEPKSAVVLTFDRWGAPYGGCYGAGWLATPELNRLAARSALWEATWAESADLALTYRSWFTGRHAAATPAEGPGLAEQLAAEGIPSRLITDCPTLAGLPLADEFTELIEVDTPWPEAPAEDWQETQLARCAAAAINALEKSPPGELLWMHARAMAGPWDAPLPWRERLRDEDDPAPYAATRPPALLLPPEHDPDETLPFQHAYAAGVMLLDACLGVLLEQLEARLAETLVIVSAPRGFPLGEHGVVGEGGGENEARLYGELLQLPLLVLDPTRRGPIRYGEPRSPGDLHATLLDWFTGREEPPRAGRGASLLREPASPWTPGRALTAVQRDAAGRETQWLLRTPAWLYRKRLDAEGEPHRELYVVPDDRFQANDVASRCGDIVALCDTELEQQLAAITSDSPSPPPALPELLVEGI